MLEIRSVSKKFNQVTAVDSVVLTIQPAQFVGIIGRSGAGKSTLLRMVNRLTDPSSGQIVFDRRDITALKGRQLHAWRAQCAMIFQQFNLMDRLDVLTNVMLGRVNRMATLASVLRLFPDRDRIDALAALEWLGIVDTVAQQAGTLSGGQQQRVAIARALHQQPKMILADEPIASLDPMNAALVMDALKRIHEERGITVICNLHTLDTARTYCNRIIGMSQGRVTFDGPPAALTEAATREIYGAGQEFNEAATSTSLDGMPRPAGAAADLQPAPVTAS